MNDGKKNQAWKTGTGYALDETNLKQINIKNDEMYWSNPSELESEELSDEDLDTSIISLTR